MLEQFLFFLLLLFIVINIHFILLLLQVLEYIVVVANLWSRQGLTYLNLW